MVLLAKVATVGCLSNESLNKDKEENQKEQLLSILTNSNNRADCVYCSDTQAFGGNCSCYSNIPVLSCMGMPSGAAKSNSYKVSCANLVTLGTWFRINSNTYSCNYQTCPPEAYRAAFTQEGR
ncbi:hypothetical protein [Leptospira perolatii]|nr:hypothetical protein [Leptospira perolatii]